MVVADPIAVPDVVGAPQNTAASRIGSANLTVGTIGTRNTPTVPLNAVISQSPAVGTLVARLSPVDLVVSLGPAPSGTVPDVVGQQQSSAHVDIVAAGFAVGPVTGVFTAAVAAGIVLTQDPAGGSVAPANSPSQPGSLGG